MTMSAHLWLIKNPAQECTGYDDFARGDRAASSCEGISDYRPRYFAPSELNMTMFAHLWLIKKPAQECTGYDIIANHVPFDRLRVRSLEKRPAQECAGYDIVAELRTHR